MKIYHNFKEIDSYVFVVPDSVVKFNLDKKTEIFFSLKLSKRNSPIDVFELNRKEQSEMYLKNFDDWKIVDLKSETNLHLWFWTKIVRVFTNLRFFSFDEVKELLDDIYNNDSFNKHLSFFTAKERYEEYIKNAYKIPLSPKVIKFDNKLFFELSEMHCFYYNLTNKKIIEEPIKRDNLVENYEALFLDSVKEFVNSESFESKAKKIAQKYMKNDNTIFNLHSFLIMVFYEKLDKLREQYKKIFRGD